MKKKSFVVMIPALNEEQNLEMLIPQLIPHYSIVVIDNGSTDRTSEISSQFGAQVIPQEAKGYGNALLAGIQYMKSLETPPHFVIIADGDGSCSPANIHKVADLISNSPFDLLIACRNPSDPLPLYALLGNRLTLFLIYLLTGKKFRDLGPLRVITWNALSKLNMENTNCGWNVEMHIKSQSRGILTQEITLSYLERVHGKSKITKNIRGAFKAGSQMLFYTAYYGMSEYLKKRWPNIYLEKEKKKSPNNEVRGF